MAELLVNVDGPALRTDLPLRILVGRFGNIVRWTLHGYTNWCHERIGTVITARVGGNKLEQPGIVATLPPFALRRR
jgi:hypothetical protein